MEHGCSGVYEDRLLGNILPANILELLEKMRFEEQLEQAQVKVSYCPKCPWGVEIDNDEEKLVECRNEGCRYVSCRTCFREDHLPLSCEGELHTSLYVIIIDRTEVEEALGSGRHKVEDAMTDAMIRSCAKCHTEFIKEPEDCNRVVVCRLLMFSLMIVPQLLHCYMLHVREGAGRRRQEPLHYW